MLRLAAAASLALLALSLALVWGCGGILSLGQTAFFGIGGYGCAVAAANLGPGAAVAPAALAAAAVGYFVLYGRLGDVYLAVVILAVTLILYNVFRRASGPEYRIGDALLGGFNGIAAPALEAAGLRAARARVPVLRGVDVTRAPAHRRSGLGLGYLSQGGGVFADLPVRDTLRMGPPARGADSRTALEAAVQAFLGLRPLLGRRGGDLSGGRRYRAGGGRELSRLRCLRDPHRRLTAEASPYPVPPDPGRRRPGSYGYVSADFPVLEADPRAGADGDSIQGEVAGIRFRNEENGWSVLRIDCEGEADQVVVVGNVDRVAEGERITAWGEWVADARYGRQFRARRIESSPPSSPAGIEKYLASSLVKGVGPVYAKKLIAAFGTDVLRVIDTEPERIQEVPGIGRKRSEQILEAWNEQRALRGIMIFLQENGLGAGRAAAVYSAYGDNTIDFVRRNPYRLARDIRGIGFQTADGFAMRLGIERNAPARLQAGLVHTLLQAAGDGHCGLPENGEDGIVAKAAAILDVGGDEVAEVLERAIAAGELVRDLREGIPCVFRPDLLADEQAVAAGLRRLFDAPLPWREIDGGRALAWAERNGGVRLSGSQRDALLQALQSKVLVVTGGPGVGKTTIVKSLLQILQAKGVALELCAPTGRAANRLAVTTGSPARTIHRLLEINPKLGEFRRNEDSPLECDLVIVDEASMVDVPLMAALVRALRRETALVVVGDVDQLPSVGPGNVLGDIIASGAVPVARLTEVYRQAAESLIVTNAHRMNRGEDPEFAPRGSDGDFFFVNEEHPQAAAAQIARVVASHIPRRFGLSAMTEVQVLTPMRNGPLGTRALNDLLRGELNPGAARVERRGGEGFSIGDRVMQTENDYEKEVYNGEIGIVRAIDPGAKTLSADIGGKRVDYGYGELQKLTLAYAVTIHKSQGSEYPAVVIPVSMQHFIMLRRNLFYTAVTRAERLVVFVGQRKALHTAIRNAGGRDRCTKLRELLARAG